MIKRFAFGALVALVVVLVLGVAAISALTLTGPGRTMLAGLINSVASSEDLAIETRDLDGILSGALRVGGVTLSDREGPWLVVERISMDWSPSALFSREVSIDRLLLERVHVIRRPLPSSAQAEDPQSSGTAGGLPVSVFLRDFAVRRLQISEAVAGSDFDLRTSGHASVVADPLKVSLEAKVERDDDIAGSARAMIAFAPDDNVLDLDISVREPPGGAVAGLLRLPGNPAVELALTGAGSLADWSAEIALDLDGTRTVEGQAGLAITESETAAKADITGALADLLPEPYRTVFAGTTELVLDGARTADGGVHIRQANLTTKVLTVNAGGALDPTGGTVDLTGKLALSPDAGWLAPNPADPALRVRAPRATFEARGSMSDAAWTVSADLDGMKTEPATTGPVNLVASGRGADLQAMAIPFDVDLKIDRLTLANPQAAQLVDGTVTLKTGGAVDGDVLRIEQATLTARQLSAQISAWFDRAASTFEAKLQADTAWPVDAEALPALASDRLALTALLSGDGDGAVQAKDVAIRSQALTLDADAGFDGETVSAEAKGRLSDLSLFNPDMAGAIALDLEASGPAAGAEIEIIATGSDIALKGQAVDAPTLEASLVASAAAPSGTLSLKAGFAGEPLTASAKLSTEETGIRRIRDLLFEFAGTKLQGTLALQPNGVPAGTIALNALDLSRIAPLLLVDMSGTLKAKADFIDDNGALRIIASASAPETRYADIAIDEARLSATVDDALGTPRANGSATVRQVLAGTTDVSDIVVNVASTDAPGTTAFDVKAVAAGIPAKVGGRVSVADGQTAIMLEQAEARYKGIVPKLARPAEIVLADGVTRIGETVLDVGGGRLTISGTAAQTLAIEAQLARIPMKLVDAVAPGTGAAGSLNGNVTVSGPSANPAIAYDAVWSRAAFAATRGAGIPPLSLSAKGLLQDNATDFKAGVGGYPGLAINAAGRVSLAGAKNLSIDVTGKLPFTLLDRPLSGSGLRLTGAGALDVDVGGSLAKPAVSGTFTTSGATFLDTNTSLVIRQLALKAGLSLDEINIERLSGTLASGGALTAGGRIGISPGSNLPADLSLKIADGRYADGQLVSTEFNADMSVKGPLQGAATIGGTVVLDRVDITIPEKLPRSIASLSVKHRNAPQAVVRQNKAIAPKQKPKSQSGGPEMQLDLAIRAANRIFIRGRGMDAELGGSLTLKGPVSSPVALGRFAMRRGRLSILSQRFDFSRGAIGFSGSLDPELDFAANTIVESTTVTVGVTGAASNPQIGLSSSPDLPDEEILALLLFRRGLADITPIQAAQLASAVATLGGIGGSYGVVDRVRDSLGLSDIDISSDADGKAKVTVGRQLGDKVYLGVEQGVGKDSSRVKIDIDLTKNLKARAEVGADGKSKGGLFFERNY